MKGFILSNPPFRKRLVHAPVKNDVTLQIGGITPFTTIDFPGKLAAVIFCQGCPWRCRYCHNRHLLPAGIAGKHVWADVMQWLETRRGLLDGLVFSGGEPLLQRQLPDAAKAVREQGFAVALHTSGVYPDRLRDILPLVDWVGLDIKAPFDEYSLVTGGGDGSRTRDALHYIVQAGIPHELRCTLDPDFFDAARAGKMAMQLAQAGVSHLVLQACRDDVTRRNRSVPDEVLDAIRAQLPSVTCRF